MAVLFRFEDDLRLYDNPGLTAAADHARQAGLPLHCIYVSDTSCDGPYALGHAAKRWRQRALASLNRALGGKLAVYSGDPATLLPRIAAATRAKCIFWNSSPRPDRCDRDHKIKQLLEDAGVAVTQTCAALLWSPGTITKSDATPYKVFTPFFERGCMAASPPRTPLPSPDLEVLKAVPHHAAPDGETKPTETVIAGWDISEDAAYNQLDTFAATKLADYKENRDYPGVCGVSRLSPYISHGQISPHTIWHRIQAEQDVGESERLAFLRQLAWREFSYYLLWHFPALPERNWRTAFDAFPWQEDSAALARWQQGETGFPMVDAGMRELLETGHMHNRVRMITASFLVKNLRMHWRLGAAWFHEHLFDADIANNSAGWQWVAGCGADAAPYFRIFNPITQGRKFDADGNYIRRFVKELGGVSAPSIHQPWKLAGGMAADYPQPVVDLAASRRAALEAAAQMKAAQSN